MYIHIYAHCSHINCKLSKLHIKIVYKKKIFRKIRIFNIKCNLDIFIHYQRCCTYQFFLLEKHLLCSMPQSLYQISILEKYKFTNRSDFGLFIKLFFFFKYIGWLNALIPTWCLHGKIFLSVGVFVYCITGRTKMMKVLKKVK